MKFIFLIIFSIILLSNLIKEGYSIWKSNPHIRYGKYNIRNRNRKAKKQLNRKYTVVYMPDNRTQYNRMSSSYTKTK